MGSKMIPDLVQLTRKAFEAIQSDLANAKSAEDKERVAKAAARMDIMLKGKFTDCKELFARAERLAKAYSSNWRELNESDKWDLIDLLEQALRETTVS